MNNIEINVICSFCNAGILLDRYPTEERVIEYTEEIKCIFCGQINDSPVVRKLKRYYKIKKIKNKCQNLII